MKVLRELAQMMGDGGEEMMAGRSDFPNMRNGDFDPSMLEGIIDIQELPQMYKELDDEVVKESKWQLEQYRVVHLVAKHCLLTLFRHWYVSQ